MATEEGNDGGGVDRISSLPDDLLHAILIRLRDPAARTSVLSRRWRRVWAHLPELSFRWRHDAPRLLASARSRGRRAGRVRRDGH